MDESARHRMMGPPPTVVVTPSTPNPNPSRSNDAPLPASSSGNRTAAPPRRIIKKINLDFNKLKEAGLDRKLAEVLSKQNPSLRSGGAPSTSNSHPPAAVSQSTSTATATALPTQLQQQLRQPAPPQPVKKRSIISDYIEKVMPNQTVAERSMQVKALVKNRILNKQAGSPQTSAQAAASRSSGAVQTNPGVFSSPIAKADLTVRQKQPPLLLNLVNQLPKHRAMCGGSRRTISRAQEQIPAQIPQQFAVQAPPQIAKNPPMEQPPPPPVSLRLQKGPSPPLIVLENKVLAPNEKIDLSGLTLPQTKAQEKPDVTNLQALISTRPVSGKVILSTQKLRVPRERLVEMAKEIRTQVKQVEVRPQVETVLTISSPINSNTSNVKPKQFPKAEEHHSKMETPSTPEQEEEVPVYSSTILEPKQLRVYNISGRAAGDYNMETPTSEPEEVPIFRPSIIEPKELSKTLITPILGSSSTPSRTFEPKQFSVYNSPKDLPKTLISPIIKASSTPLTTSEPEQYPIIEPTELPSNPEPIEPQETVIPEPNPIKPPKVLSAVDFIAQLSADNTLDESSLMELSPEEQRLNALFGGGGGGYGASSAKADLAIGKIVKMDDMNILHATLDVNSDCANILRISPNAMKLQNSVASLDVSSAIMMEDSVSANLSTLIVPEPIEVNVMEEKEPSENWNPSSKSAAKEPTNAEVPLEQIQPVSHSEPAKDVKPPPRRIPLRSKKAKINLVQRTKRPSIPSATEPKKTKLDLVENEAERNGVQEIEVMGNLDSLRSDKVNFNLSSVIINPKVLTDEGQPEDVIREEQSKNPEGNPKEAITEEVDPVEANIKSQDEQEEQMLTKPATERDLTQLYHPPKMPKNKASKGNQNQEESEDPQPAAKSSNVSLVEIVTQKPPPPQGEAQLPFRKESAEDPPSVCSTPEVTGIQNLIGHLTAEKVNPQIKKQSPSSEDTSKALPRKKLVKTRPVLSKRPSKVGQKNPSENSINPNEAEGHRAPTSSTSDDDGSMFLGFDIKEEKRSRTPVRSKRVGQMMRINETDISDDATPDYDETEEEQLPQGKKILPELDLAESNDILEKHNKESYDSDSSCPRDFGGSASNDGERSLDEFPIMEKSLEVVAVDGVNKGEKEQEQVQEIAKQPEQPENTDLGTESSGEELIAPNVINDILNEISKDEKQLVTVIKESDSAICEGKPRKSPRKSTKLIVTEMETPLIQSDIEESSTSKESKTMVNGKAKRQPRGGLKTSYSLERTENAVSTETHREESSLISESSEGTVSKEKEIEKLIEVPTTPGGTKAKRQSRSRTNKIEATSVSQAETIPEPTEYSENTDSKEESGETIKSKRQTRTSKLKVPDSTDTEKVSIAEKTEIKPNIGRKRLSRNRNLDANLDLDADSGSKELIEPLEEIKVPEPANVDPNVKRLSRSRTPKVIDQAPAEEPTTSQELQEQDKAAEEHKDVKKLAKAKGNRKSRSQTPKLVAPTEEKSDESNINTNSQTELETPEVPKAGTSDKTKGNRKSLGRKPKPVETPVINEKEKVSKDQDKEVKGVEKPNVAPTSLQLKRKRHSPSGTPKAVPPDAHSLVEPKIAEDLPTQTPVAKAKRKTQTRLGSDPPPAEVSVSDDEAPLKRSRNSNVATPIQKKERAKSKNIDKTPQAKEETETEATPKPLKRGRGRKRAADLDKEVAIKLKTEGEASPALGTSAFNLRLLLIRKREQLNTDEVLTEEGKGKGPLQCGLCLARTTEQEWRMHVSEHYGVGWPIEETPQFVSRSTILSMMRVYQQEIEDTSFNCRLCNNRLGSHLGMLLHLEGCGNKRRLECEFCKRSYSFSTFPQHQRSCWKRLQPPEEMETESNDAGPSEPVFSNAGRAKRRSTIKAETKLKKIGKELESGKPGEQSSTKLDFDGDTSDYDMAKDKESSEEYESEGVDSTEDPFHTDDEGTEAKPGKGDHRARKKKAIRRAPPAGSSVVHRKPCKLEIFLELNYILSIIFSTVFARYFNVEARMAQKWKEFQQASYAKDPLFPQLRASYFTISSAEANDLLPSKESSSMRYAYGNVKKENAWKQLAPLEGFNQKGEYIGYLGGSVKQLAWFPLPAKVKEQYLLCSLRPKMQSFVRHSKVGNEDDALLMLLKCTVGDSGLGQKSWNLRPELHYGIRVSNGPVHCFAVLPSGGYDAEANRLGLLAVANTTSDVHIYALPLELTEEEKTSEHVVIQLHPLITLSLDINTPVQDQCTQICWSQSSGHNFLVTGYGNGNVAFWDIGDVDSLNCIKQNERTYILPLNTLYIGERNVQFLDIHYDTNGPRWLAVGTLVRVFTIYDIANWSQPVPLIQDPIHHLYVSDLCWSPICETVVVSSNDMFMTRFTRNIALSPSGVQYDYKTIDSTVGPSRGIHANPLQNLSVLVTDNGDVAFVDVRNLNFEPCLVKSAVNSRAVSTAELCYLGESARDSKARITVDEFLRDYGLQMNPFIPISSKNRTSYLNEKRIPRDTDILAMTRLNCVRCNWNAPTHTWVALGAEHGLLRIINFDRDKFFPISK
ncbi:hypothetical protein KR009_011133 [Drosophila setifemur]|nr:hypothetical protein KR009_011133 [Drosophila setifemur]